MSHEKPWLDLLSLSVKQWRAFRSSSEPSHLRQLARRGIPASVRGAAWCLLLDLPHEGLSESLAYDLASRGGDLGVTIDTTICEEVIRTLRMAAERTAELERLLTAVITRDPTVGLARSLYFLAGFLLASNISEARSFAILGKLSRDYRLGCILLRRESSAGELAEMLSRLDWMVARQLPELHAHLRSVGVSVPMVAGAWFSSLFAESLPTDIVARVWDIFIEAGPGTAAAGNGCWDIVFRISLALLHLAAGPISLQAMPPQQILEHLRELQQNMSKELLLITALRLELPSTTAFGRTTTKKKNNNMTERQAAAAAAAAAAAGSLGSVDLPPLVESDGTATALSLHAGSRLVVQSPSPKSRSPKGAARVGIEIGNLAGLRAAVNEEWDRYRQLREERYAEELLSQERMAAVASDREEAMRALEVEKSRLDRFARQKKEVEAAIMQAEQRKKDVELESSERDTLQDLIAHAETQQWIAEQRRLALLEGERKRLERLERERHSWLKDKSEMDIRRRQLLERRRIKYRPVYVPPTEPHPSETILVAPSMAAVATTTTSGAAAATSKPDGGGTNSQGQRQRHHFKVTSPLHRTDFHKLSSTSKAWAATVNKFLAKARSAADNLPSDDGDTKSDSATVEAGGGKSPNHYAQEHWVEHFDGDSGSMYYINDSTGESQWDKPRAPQAVIRALGSNEYEKYG